MRNRSRFLVGGFALLCFGCVVGTTLVHAVFAASTGNGVPIKVAQVAAVSTTALAPATNQRIVVQEEPTSLITSESIITEIKTNTATSSDSITVTAGTQPAQTIAPAGAGGVPFTNITLTAGNTDVTIDSFTVELAGMGASGAFDSIALNDDTGAQIGDEGHFNSNRQAKIGDTVTIPANTSKTFTVVGNMSDDLTNFDGQMPMLQIDTVNTSVPVVGGLPVRGTAQTVNTSLTIGGAIATLSQFDPGTSRNQYVNDTGVRFSGIRITANSRENLTLNSITWDQGGTAGSSDIANVATVVNGTSYPADVDGRSYTSTFSPGITIPKGQTIDVYVQGDITITGSNRTVEFDIDSSDDVSLTGNEYGFGVGIAAGGNTATAGNSVFITDTGDTDGEEGSPFFSGSTATINSGTATYIGK